MEVYIFLLALLVGWGLYTSIKILVRDYPNAKKKIFDLNYKMKEMEKVHNSRIDDIHAKYKSEMFAYRRDVDREKDEIRGLKLEIRKERDLIKEQRRNTIPELKEEYERKKNDLEYLYVEKEDHLKEQYDIKFNNIEQKKKEVEAVAKETIRKYRELVEAKSPFKQSARICADIEARAFETAESIMILKDHRTSAEKVKQCKIKFKESEAKLKEMQYKFDYLLGLYPWLAEYVDESDEDIFVTEEDYPDDMGDRVRYWVPEEEYRNLTADERNQLALNRYKQRKISNHQAGIDYEQYIGYLLRKRGYRVEQFGVERGLEDLGRDIIATKGNIGIGQYTHSIYVIQCKRYKKDGKYIVRENTICQTFGTAKEYALSHQHLVNCEIIPVICTTKEPSDTAMRFADMLGVKVWVIAMGEYPMIKCNINQQTGERIYHLPFDQQYKNAQINKPGEFYAFTVKEAVEKGFRRAMRYNNNLI